MVDGSNKQTICTEMAVFRRKHYLFTLLLMTAGMLGLHFSVTRPIQNQLNQQQAKLQWRLATVDQRMSQLVDERETLEASNTLLSQLRIQQERLNEASDSLADVQNSIIHQKGLAPSASNAVDALSCLQQRLIGEGKTTDAAAHALDRIADVNSRISMNAAGVDEAVRELQRLGDLKSKVLAEAMGISIARQAAQNLVDLKNHLNHNAAGTIAAHQHADALVKLRNRIDNDRGGAEVAGLNDDRLMQIRDDLREHVAESIHTRKTANRMTAIVAELTAKAVDAEVATRDLKSLLTLHTELQDRNRAIASTMQTIELLGDLQLELTDNYDSLPGFGKLLTEVVLLDNTFAKTIRMLQPWIQFANERRLDAREAAAQPIIRRPTMARRPASSYYRNDAPARQTTPMKSTSDEDMYQGLVPWPSKDE